MTVDPLWLGVSAAAGVLLALFYFGGLWWTTRRLLRSRRPGWLLAGSFGLRVGVVLAGLLLVAGGRPERLAAGLLAFFATRLAVVRLVGSPAERSAVRDGNQP